MKIKFSPYEALYYLITAMLVGIFLIFGIKIDTLRNYGTILSIVSLILFIPTFIYRFKSFPKSAKFYSVLLIACIFLGVYIASTRYGYNISNIFFVSRQYIWIMLFWLPLVLFIQKQSNFDKVIRNIINILIFSLCIRAFVWATYTYGDLELFPTILREFGDLWFRNETSVRVDGTPLIAVGILLSYYQYLNTRSKLDLFKIIFILGYIVFVAQTRMLTFTLICALVVMNLAIKDNNLKKLKTATTTSVLLLISVGMLFSNKIVLFFGDMAAKQDLGIGYRFWEMKYYQSILLPDNWKLGMGALTSSNPDAQFVLNGARGTKMFLDDLGIYELFFQFGVLSLLLYGFLIYKLIVLIRRLNHEMIKERALFIGFLVYIILSMISLNIYGIQRSFSLSFILAIMFYIDYLLNNMRKHENG